MEQDFRKLSLQVASVILIALCSQAQSQANLLPGSAQSPAVAKDPQQKPAYEVATIKPAPPGRFHYSLRRSISSAYGYPPNTSWGVIGGPDWIDSADYVIQGKPPETIRATMQAMTFEQRSEEWRLMQQNLLEDRFKLKAHFETRELKVYELTVAKNGSKLKENSDTRRGIGAVGPSMIRGMAMPMKGILGALQGSPEMEGQPLIDKTGLSGNYEFLLRWAPMQSTTAIGDTSGVTPSTDTDRPSLFTAIEEQLGLKLVPTRGPVKVLVIDHIDRPTEN